LTDRLEVDPTQTLRFSRAGDAAQIIAKHPEEIRLNYMEEPHGLRDGTVQDSGPLEPSVLFLNIERG
jgi:hypothetical protein